MCQQWFSVAGLVLEVAGFLFVAWEWRHVFEHNVLARQDATEADYALAIKGEEAARERQWAVASMWRNTQRENLLDYKHRARVFPAWCWYCSDFWDS